MRNDSRKTRTLLNACNSLLRPPVQACPPSQVSRRTRGFDVGIQAFQIPIDDDHRCNDLVDVPLPTHGVDHHIGRVKVSAATRHEPESIHKYRLSKGRLSGLLGDAKVLFPVGNECYATSSVWLAHDGDGFGSARRRACYMIGMQMRVDHLNPTQLELLDELQVAIHFSGR